MPLALVCAATFGWLCVETTGDSSTLSAKKMQPPSGGCVLKQALSKMEDNGDSSHLRVAVCWNPRSVTIVTLSVSSHLRVAVCWNQDPPFTLDEIEPQPPSGGCVLKQLVHFHFQPPLIAATFGWLCVETLRRKKALILTSSSHLRVAVCWNNYNWCCYSIYIWQPPSGGCVLKLGCMLCCQLC